MHRPQRKNWPKSLGPSLLIPIYAAEKGIIDVVIDPMETRPFIIRALECLANKREIRPPKKHGNINL